jgi:hypothetical protein
MKILKSRSDSTSVDTIAKKRDMLEVSRMVKRNSNTANIYYSSKGIETRLTAHYYNFLSLIFFQTIVISSKMSNKKHNSLYYDSEETAGDDSDEDDSDLDPDWQNTPIFKRLQKLKVPHLLLCMLVYCDK